MNVDWQGVFVTTTTQFRADGSLDLPATARHLDRLIDDGVHGLVVLDHVGEAESLELDEKRAVLKVALDINNGRVPVLSCIAEESTPAACDFAFEAEMLGADGLVLRPHPAAHEEAHDSVGFVRSVAAACGLPLLLGEHADSVASMTSLVCRELAEVEKLVALHVSFARGTEISDSFDNGGDRYLRFGDVADLLQAKDASSITGILAPFANAFPRDHARAWEEATTGQLDAAQRRSKWWDTLCAWQRSPDVVQFLKLCVTECGWGNELVRPPRSVLVGDEREQALRSVRALLEDRLPVE